MLMDEVALLVASTTPYLSAALSAYGAAVLAKVKDDTADATVSIGRRLLQRVFGKRKEREPLPTALAEAAAAPGDADALGALRLAIRRELEGDAVLLAAVRELLNSTPGTVHAPTIRSGRDTYYAGRDMAVTRPVEQPHAADPESAVGG